MHIARLVLLFLVDLSTIIHGCVHDFLCLIVIFITFQHRPAKSLEDCILIMQALLLFFTFPIAYVSIVLSRCTVQSYCQVRGTSGTSTNSTSLSLPPYLPNCLSLCSRSDSCFATTHDITTDTCELHEESQGPECLVMHADLGKTLWHKKHKDATCLTVGYRIIVNTFRRQCFKQKDIDKCQGEQCRSQCGKDNEIQLSNLL